MTSETQTASESTGRDYAPYDPASVETRVYESGCGRACSSRSSDEEAGGKRPFVMTMPPPNVTGGLHIGHALRGASRTS